MATGKDRVLVWKDNEVKIIIQFFCFGMIIFLRQINGSTRILAIDDEIGSTLRECGIFHTGKQ